MSYNPHGSGLILPGKTPDERLQHRLTSIEHASEEQWRGQTKWTDASYGSGWSTYSGSFYGAQYKRDQTGRVWLRGLVKNTSYITATIFTLPTGFRPAFGHHFPIAASDAYGQIYVGPGGTVEHQNGLSTWLSLATVSFDVAA